MTTTGALRKLGWLVGEETFYKFFLKLYCLIRMLGSNLGIPVKKSFFGAADRGTQFWRSELQCTGSEENLEDCEGKEMPSCARGEVAGLICYFGGDLRKLAIYNFIKC